jgi:hypothetical protein
MLNTPFAISQAAFFTLNEIDKRDMDKSVRFCAIINAIRRIKKNADILKKNGKLDLFYEYLKEKISDESVFINYLMYELNDCISHKEYDLAKLIMIYKSTNDLIREGFLNYISICILDEIVEKTNRIKLDIIEKYREYLRPLELDNSSRTVGIYGTGRHTENLLAIYERFIGHIKANIYYINSDAEGEAFGRKLVSCKDSIKVGLEFIIISSFMYRDEFRTNIDQAYNNSIKIMDFYNSRSYVDLFSWIDIGEFCNKQ